MCIGEAAVRMRVIHYYPVWLPTTMVWLFNEVRHLPSDIETHVVCDRTEGLDRFRVPDIHCLAQLGPVRRYWNLGLRRLRMARPSTFLGDVIRHRNIDLLHSHFGHVGWINIPIARRAGIRHVVSFYGLDVNYLPIRNPIWRRRYDAMFTHVDAVLCEGPHMAECVAALGCPREKLRVHRLGVPVERIPFLPRAWQPGEPLRVLMAASFREKKGIPLALQALARLARKVPLEVTLVGGPGSEPRARSEHRAILSVIEREDMQPYVRLPGFLSHDRLMEEARGHHVFISPSLTAGDGDTEGGAPVTLIDMAARGLVLVSTRHCDIPQIVDHGATGLLSSERDLDGLVANLVWLVEHPGAWDAMRAAARKHVETYFDARRQGARLAAIYRELMG